MEETSCKLPDDETLHQNMSIEECPICNLHFHSHQTSREREVHVNGCLDNKQTSQNNQTHEQTCPDISKHEQTGLDGSLGKSVSGINSRNEEDNDALLARSLQEQSWAEHFQNDSGVYICTVCLKDLSHMNVARRSLHMNTCADKSIKDSKSHKNNKKICPMCGKLHSEQKFVTHLKQCATKKNIPTSQLLKILQKSEPRNAENCKGRAKRMDNKHKAKTSKKLAEPVQLKVKVSREELLQRARKIAMVEKRDNTEKHTENISKKVEGCRLWNLASYQKREKSFFTKDLHPSIGPVEKNETEDLDGSQKNIDSESDEKYDTDDVTDTQRDKVTDLIEISSTGFIKPGPESNILEQLGSLVENAFFSDFTFRCKDSRDVLAHRCILALRSPYFKHYLSEGKRQEMDVSDFSHDSVRFILRHIYTGEIENPPEHLSDEVHSLINRFELVDLVIKEDPKDVDGNTEDMEETHKDVDEIISTFWKSQKQPSESNDSDQDEEDINDCFSDDQDVEQLFRSQQNNDEIEKPLSIDDSLPHSSENNDVEDNNTCLNLQNSPGSPLRKFDQITEPCTNKNISIEQSRTEELPTIPSSDFANELPSESFEHDSDKKSSCKNPTSEVDRENNWYTNKSCVGSNNITSPTSPDSGTPIPFSCETPCLFESKSLAQSLCEQGSFEDNQSPCVLSQRFTSSTPFVGTQTRNQQSAIMLSPLQLYTTPNNPTQHNIREKASSTEDLPTKRQLSSDDIPTKRQLSSDSSVSDTNELKKLTPVRKKRFRSSYTPVVTPKIPSQDRQLKPRQTQQSIADDFERSSESLNVSDEEKEAEKNSDDKVIQLDKINNALDSTNVRTIRNSKEDGHIFIEDSFIAYNSMNDFQHDPQPNDVSGVSKRLSRKQSYENERFLENSPSSQNEQFRVNEQPPGNKQFHQNNDPSFKNKQSPSKSFLLNNEQSHYDELSQRPLIESFQQSEFSQRPLHELSLQNNTRDSDQKGVSLDPPVDNFSFYEQHDSFADAYINSHHVSIETSHTETDDNVPSKSVPDIPTESVANEQADILKKKTIKFCLQKPKSNQELNSSPLNIPLYDSVEDVTNPVVENTNCVTKSKVASATKRTSREKLSTSKQSQTSNVTKESCTLTKEDTSGTSVLTQEFSVMVTPLCKKYKKFGPGCNVHPETNQPITPMPDFSQLPTPELIERIKSYALRDLPKNKMAAKMKEIYKFQHQFREWEEDAADLKKNHRKRKKKNEETTVAEMKKSEETTIAETKKTRKRGSQSTEELNTILLRFFQSNDTLYQKIIQYEPLDFTDLLEELKSQAITCTKKNLETFLDKQCICYFTSKDEVEPRRKQRKKK